MKVKIYFYEHLEALHKNNFPIEEVRRSKYLQEKLLRPGHHDFVCYRFLKDEIHEWLVEYQISYTIGWSDTNIRWYIDIPDISDAVLFKITWL